MQLKVASHKCLIQNLKLSKKMIGGRTHNSKEKKIAFHAQTLVLKISEILDDVTF